MTKFKTTVKNKKIYGELITRDSSDRLIVVLSGFSGGMNSSLMRASLNYFSKQNNVLIFNFCNDDHCKNADSFSIRELNKELYIKILQTIIKKFSGNYKKITLIGHSFSAALMLYLIKTIHDPRIDTVVMWDPSIVSDLIKTVRKQLKFDPVLAQYYDNLGKKKGFVFSTKLVRSFESGPDPLDFISRLNYTILIIGAQNGAKENALRYKKATTNKKVTCKIISKSGHLFGNQKSRRKLFKITSAFINRNQD